MEVFPEYLLNLPGLSGPEKAVINKYTCKLISYRLMDKGPLLRQSLLHR